jgi:hypothetical protein
MGNAVMLTQTGVQTIHGGLSKGEGLEKFGDMEKQGPMAGGPMPMGAKGAGPQLDKAETDSSPWMIAFGVFVVGGLLVGLALPLESVRRKLLGVCALGAIVSLAIPTAVGFPLGKEIDKANKEMKAQAAPKVEPGGNPFDMMGGQMAAGMADAMSIKVRYTPWFYLTWACIVASFVLVVAEAMAGAPKPSMSPGVNPGAIT